MCLQMMGMFLILTNVFALGNMGSVEGFYRQCLWVTIIMGIIGLIGCAFFGVTEKNKSIVGMEKK